MWSLGSLGSENFPPRTAPIFGGICMEYVWNMYEYVWNMYGICMEYV
jgi:hypothetical protein